MLVTPDGYRQTTYGYGVPFSAAGESSALGPDWRLDNFACDGGGHCEEKRGKEYVAWRHYDEDRDGTISFKEKTKEAIYDVRFVNEVHGGVIWAKAHPVHPEDARLELSTILSAYADSLAGAGLYAQGSVFGIEQPKARQFTTFVSDANETKLGPHKAFAATVELAEVAKLAQDPAHRDGKVRVILTKFQHFRPLGHWEKEAVEQGDVDSLDVSVVERDGQHVVANMALLMVGYYNTASRFDDARSDFEAFVSSLTFDPSVSGPYPELRVGRIESTAAGPAADAPEDTTESDSPGVRKEGASAVPEG